MRAVLHRLLHRQARSSALSEPYEPELTAAIERAVEPGWSCADVGAHVGNITETLVRLVGAQGRVVAFEAHPTNAAQLSDRFRHAQAVEVVNAAVSDGSAESIALYAGRPDNSSEWNVLGIPLYVGRRDNSSEWNVLGHDVGGTPTQRVLEVPAVSLDDWFSPGEPLQFVKIDVEGAEGLVLAGMRRLLREARPVLAVEFHDDEAWTARRELLEAGYELSRTDGSPIDPEGARAYHVIAWPRDS